MVIKNQRVRNILDLIEQFGIAGMSHVYRLYYKPGKHNLRNAQQKMRNLFEEGTLKRKRNDINSEYVYWLADKKPLAYPQHRLVLLDFYVLLCKKYGINNVEIEVEYTNIDGIRPDAYIRIKLPKGTKLVFVEIHLSNNDTNLEKYIVAAKKQPFGEGIFPYIIVISDRKITVSREVNETLTVIVDNLKMSKLEGIV
jgi:hypothetical protein